MIRNKQERLEKRNARIVLKAAETSAPRKNENQAEKRKAERHARKDLITAARNMEIEKLLKKGLPVSAIAKQLRMRRSTVSIYKNNLRNVV